VLCDGEAAPAGPFVPSQHAPTHLPTVSIGEGDPALPRLEDHFAQKDFWTSLILFTSKDENLNKAHAQHLESRLTALAREAKRCLLDNVNTPQLPSIRHRPPRASCSAVPPTGAPSGRTRTGGR
jgi:hypothetical protein